MAIARKTKYSDFTTQFMIHPVSNDLARITEIDAIRRSVKNLILTDKYERLLDPKIGSNIRKCLFEPMDGTTTLVLQNYIKETIHNYEPRVILRQVSVIADYDHNAYSVSIIFAVTISESVQTLTFYLNRVR